MYIVCPVCDTASWIPMGNGILVKYDNGETIVPETILNKKHINWRCKCVKTQTETLSNKSKSK